MRFLLYTSVLDRLVEACAFREYVTYYFYNKMVQKKNNYSARKFIHQLFPSLMGHSSNYFFLMVIDNQVNSLVPAALYLFFFFLASLGIVENL